MTAEQRVSRASRWFVAASAWWLVLGLVAIVADARHRVVVVLLLVQIASLVLTVDPWVFAGELLTLAAVLAHALLLTGLFVDR